MRIWYHNVLGGERAAATVSGDQVTIGRDDRNSLVLNSPLIADRAIVLKNQPTGWKIIALGVNGCEIGGVPLRAGEHSLLRHGDKVRLFPFILEFELQTTTPGGASGATASAAPAWALDQAAKLVQKLHARLLREVDAASFERAQREGGDALLRLEHCIDSLSHAMHVGTRPRDPLTQFIAGQGLRGILIDQLIADADRPGSPWLNRDSAWNHLASAVAEREHDVEELRLQLVEDLDLDAVDQLTQRLNLVEQHYWEQWLQLGPTLYHELITYLARRTIKKQIKDIVFGYGPLEDLVRLPDVTEVMVVGSQSIFIEKNGVIESSGRRFISDEVTQSIIERIVAQVGRRIDKSQPVVDARLVDGSRVHAIIPPLAPDGPCLTIRRFPRRLTIDDLLRGQAINREAVDFLRAAVLTKACILVTGGTGSGKTTLLNCLASWIPTSERVVTIEDTTELDLQHGHVVRLEARLPNAEGAGAYTTRDLVRQSLRMRPDRIVVGECRGPEALDMLQAMNTGHRGCLTTVHANSPQDVITRLETLVQMASPLPLEAIHRQIGAAIDLIVHIERHGDQRRVSSIAEVAFDRRRALGVTIRELFHLDPTQPAAGLQPTGRLPSFAGELLESGWFQLDGFQLHSQEPRHVVVS
ncbi:MAG: Flp pilus assembly complex ATPase component TadA [Planctomycetes bacterium]|nr:Flp pilus assembly complex ATPase component TadA [Planctomycetota bacterium]